MVQISTRRQATAASMRVRRGSAFRVLATETLGGAIRLVEGWHGSVRTARVFEVTVMDHIYALKSALSDLLPDTELTVLDVGCGHESYLDLGTKAKLTGIDISAENLRKHKGLTSRILGDVQTFPLPQQEFDVVVCWDVLDA